MSYSEAACNHFPPHCTEEEVDENGNANLQYVYLGEVTSYFFRVSSRWFACLQPVSSTQSAAVLEFGMYSTFMRRHKPCWAPASAGSTAPCRFCGAAVCPEWAASVCWWDRPAGPRSTSSSSGWECQSWTPAHPTTAVRRKDKMRTRQHVHVNHHFIFLDLCLEIVPVVKMKQEAIKKKSIKFEVMWGKQKF